MFLFFFFPWTIALKLFLHYFTWRFSHSVNCEFLYRKHTNFLNHSQTTFCLLNCWFTAAHSHCQWPLEDLFLCLWNPWRIHLTLLSPLAVSIWKEKRKSLKRERTQIYICSQPHWEAILKWSQKNDGHIHNMQSQPTSVYCASSWGRHKQLLEADLLTERIPMKGRVFPWIWRFALQQEKNMQSREGRSRKSHLQPKVRDSPTTLQQWLEFRVRKQIQIPSQNLSKQYIWKLGLKLLSFPYIITDLSLDFMPIFCIHRIIQS